MAYKNAVRTINSILSKEPRYSCIKDIPLDELKELIDSLQGISADTIKNQNIKLKQKKKKLNINHSLSQPTSSKPSDVEKNETDISTETPLVKEDTYNESVKTKKLPKLIKRKKQNKKIECPKVTQETRIVRKIKTFWDVQVYTIMKHPFGEYDYELSYHPKGKCPFKCHECSGGEDRPKKCEDETEVKVNVVRIGNKPCFVNELTDEIFEIENVDSFSNHSEQQICIGTRQKADGCWDCNSHTYTFFAAKTRLTRKIPIRYEINSFDFKHPDGPCRWGCGDCNPACDDDDNESEFVNLVNVITIDGKYYYANHYNGEIYDFDMIGGKNKSYYRYADNQTVIGNTEGITTYENSRPIWGKHTIFNN